MSERLASVRRARQKRGMSSASRRGRASPYLLGAIAVVIGGVVVLAWPSSSPQPEATPSAASPEPTPAATSTAVASPRPRIEPPRPPEAPRASPSPTPSAAATRPPSGGMPAAMAGLSARTMDDRDRREFGIPERLTYGIVVTDVDPRSSAAEAHLAPNDVIFNAAGKKVTNIYDLAQIVDGRQYTKLHVYRRGQPFEIILHPPYEKKAPR